MTRRTIITITTSAIATAAITGCASFTNSKPPSSTHSGLILPDEPDTFENQQELSWRVADQDTFNKPYQPSIPQPQTQPQTQTPPQPDPKPLASTFTPNPQPATTTSKAAQPSADMAASLFGELTSVPPVDAGQATKQLGGTENLDQLTFATDGQDFDPSVSRDGERVFFASTRHHEAPDIYSKALGGSAVVQLTRDPGRDVMPAVSPDGKRVAFASDRDGSWDIYIIDAEGGPAVQVTNGAAADLHPSWNPEGNKLTFCRLSERSGRWEVWCVDTNHPASIRYLTDGLFPEWQPNGNKIAFQRHRARGQNFFSVWTIDVVDGEAMLPTEVATASDAAIINPTWSADGTMIAYATVLQRDVNQHNMPTRSDIWVQAINGSDRANLTAGRGVNLMPAWTPDGRVVFISDRNGHDNVWAMAPFDGLNPNTAIVKQPINVD